MFYVAGYPVKLFTEKVAETDGLALVPVLNKTVLEFYERSEIPAKTYGWQPTRVQTAAIKAVLVSFDFRRADVSTWGGSPKPSARTWIGSSPTGTRSGSPSTWTTRCEVGAVRLRPKVPG